MIDEIKTCVSARTDFFEKYVTVPPALQPELDSFLVKINALGEASSNAAEFEQKFQSSGLSDLFNSLVTRCTPQAYQMTKEDKAYSRQVAKEIFREDKDRILKEAGQDLLESVELKAESDLNTIRTRQMSEAGVLDEYTKASNLADDVGIIARFFKGRRDKKKKNSEF